MFLLKIPLPCAPAHPSQPYARSGRFSAHVLVTSLVSPRMYSSHIFLFAYPSDLSISSFDALQNQSFFPFKRTRNRTPRQTVGSQHSKIKRKRVKRKVAERREKRRSVSVTRCFAHFRVCLGSCLIAFSFRETSTCFGQFILDRGSLPPIFRRVTL
uniref:Uncharacterized protein TCIL3000_8_1510 n=1 Tax=Trypanosoma congolense (strain IL3000) TaxID=1068625 RepID=G0URC2_TRYCI|nr:unnamed protein product [Trypanosoma congolense IL3000]